MTDTATHFRAIVECLLDASRTPLDHLNASRAWCNWGLAMLGIDERNPASTDAALRADTPLPTGNAISPSGAVLCIREYRRTAVFLQAMDAAIRAAQERFPGQTIHVVEAGCGPMAPLAFSMAARYPPEQVTFTLVDLHATALDVAKRVAVELGIAQSIRAYVRADVTQIRFDEADRPHIIACEVLLRALTREPQVAATLNLAPQLRPGGFFVPERIAVDAVLFDSARYFELGALEVSDAPAQDEILQQRQHMAELRDAAIKELGNVFRLDADSVDRLKQDAEGNYAAGTVAFPSFDPHAQELQLFTRICVFRGHVLVDFESSLNQPVNVRLPEGSAVTGGTAQFVYEVSQDPGLRLLGPGAGQ